MTVSKILALGCCPGACRLCENRGEPRAGYGHRSEIDNFTFNPKQITVKAGDTIAWVNHDDIPHTVACEPKVRSKRSTPTTSSPFTFMTPGTYHYFCALHPAMTGTIVVEASAGK